MSSPRPAAIVLSRSITGLATIRGLGHAGIEVHAVVFSPSDPVCRSRFCKSVRIERPEIPDERLLELIVDLARRLGHRPVLLPACDAHALLIAENRPLLEPLCRIWDNTPEALRNIVSKDGLYRSASQAGVATIPSIVSPTLDQAREWSVDNPAPYLIKPFFTGIRSSSVHSKNLTLQTAAELLTYIASETPRDIIVQRLVRGGDGHIVDVYGLCDRDGRVVTLASRTRLRQYIPDYGTCTYGETPTRVSPTAEAEVFALTRRLFDSIRYHGMFDIEWLHDQATDRFYLIDFNARPAMGIGHVQAAGLNLTELAYRELNGESMRDVPSQPRLRHMYGVDLLRDVQSFLEKRQKGQLGLGDWLGSIVRSRHFFYTDWRDPGPGLQRLRQIIATSARYVWHRLIPRYPAAPLPPDQDAHGPRLIRTVEPLEFPVRLPAWWNPLFEKAGERSIFVSGAWMLDWLENYGREFRGYWVSWTSEDAVVAGCLVLLGKRRKAGIPLTTLYFNATGYTSQRSPFAEFNSVLCVAGHETAVARDLADLLPTLPWLRLNLCGYGASGVLGRLLDAMPTARVEHEDDPAYYVPLSGDTIGRFEDSLSTNTRNQLRRSRRLYESRYGPLHIERAEDLSAAHRFLDGLIPLHNRRRAAKGDSGAFESAAVNVFHRRAIESLYPVGAADLLRISAGDTTIGYLYNYIDRGKVYFYQSGFAYDTDSRLKPGLLSHALAIEHYAASGLIEYDFLCGDGQYKRSMTRHSRLLRWTTAYRDSMPVRVLLRFRQSLLRLLGTS